MITLADDGCMKVVLDGKESDAVTLVFSSLGRTGLGLEGQGPEFARVRARSRTIFVMDRRRSWGNDLDVARLVDCIGPHIRGKTVNTLGVSMGGFLAVLMSRFVEVGVAVAFVPQFILAAPGLVIRPRSRDYLQRIADMRFRSLEGAFAPATAYYVFYGDCPIDRQHFDRIPHLANIARFRIDRPSAGHYLAQRLRDDSILYPLIGDCFARKPAETILAGAFPAGYDVILA